MDSWIKNAPFGMSDADALFDKFQKLCNESANRVHLKAEISKQRISDAFNAWQEDTFRNRERNFQSVGSLPDHIKCAAILTYWLRRERPISNLEHYDVGGMYSEIEQLQIEVRYDGDPDSFGTALSEEELKKLKINSIPGDEYLKHRKRLYSYANEYLAFDFGFRLAKAYEIERQKERGNATFKVVDPGAEFIDDFCYFLKFKSVSPHAVFFIYRALLDAH